MRNNLIACWAYMDFFFIYSFLLIKEVHRLQKEADEASKRSSVLERENQRCELQLGDMAQQVDEHSSVMLKGQSYKIHAIGFYHCKCTRNCY